MGLNFLFLNLWIPVMCENLSKIWPAKLVTPLHQIAISVFVIFGPLKYRKKVCISITISHQKLLGIEQQVFELVHFICFAAIVTLFLFFFNGHFLQNDFLAFLIWKQEKMLCLSLSLGIADDRGKSCKEYW